MTTSLIVGLETSFCQDLPSKLDKLYEERITLIAAPLFHPRFRRDANGVSDSRDGPQTRSDLVLDSRGWTSSVIGNVSKWIDLDSICDHVRWTAEAVFKQELAWASHLSLTAVVTPALHSARSNTNYARILNQAASQAQSGLLAAFEAPYLDYLQAPLQPLMDNLESQTYETFEQDPVKYERYEVAITQALADTPEAKESVVMVVCHDDISDTTLCFLQWDNVTIVSSDMRVWKAPEPADIMVSELLGSFGDNELSPECLDGAQSFLREGGVSIPCKYTSFVSPISSSKLWNEVKGADANVLKGYETPYVVRLHQIFSFARPQPCFTFEHPNLNAVIDNKRYHQMTFDAIEDGVVHGLAGYFDSVLYADTCISINPETLDLSPGMFSWFPIFFPLRTPLLVRQHDKIEVCFWRQVGGGKVWYEWAVAVNDMWGPIHNPNGRSYWIGL
ncbi:hypothetical protein DYB32_004091 [Aphanomyces invadans]|uniref:Protein arginine N-methyltransferase n=1 Tax=Aphanomyces invadans TaxID=157072 RepID=A0A3R6YA54_9STRA|nr:hypothetical protein DYB32_004091 [Aphanomyces invadans]